MQARSVGLPPGGGIYADPALAATRAPLGKAIHLPPRYYTDADILEQEKAKLFLRDWPAALKTVEPLERHKGEFLQKLAHAQTQASQAKEVMEWAAKADLPVLRARAFLGVARALE